MRKQLEETLDEFQNDFENICVNEQMPLSKYQKEAFGDLKENLNNYLQGLQEDYRVRCEVKGTPLSKYQIDALNGLVIKLQFPQNIKIEDLNLTLRSYNILKVEDIGYVNQLTKLSGSELSKLTNMDKKSLREIQEKLDLRGYSRKSN